MFASRAVSYPGSMINLNHKSRIQGLRRNPDQSEL
jgi:hypothetical protein